MSGKRSGLRFRLIWRWFPINLANWPDNERRALGDWKSLLGEKNMCVSSKRKWSMSMFISYVKYSVQYITWWGGSHQSQTKLFISWLSGSLLLETLQCWPNDHELRHNHATDSAKPQDSSLHLHSVITAHLLSYNLSSPCRELDGVSQHLLPCQDCLWWAPLISKGQN